MPLSAATRAKLKTVSTATVATALYKRGFRNQMIQGVLPLNPRHPTMVGEAYTLRYIPAREDLNTLEVFKDPAHPQRRAVEECPPGAVFVIDSRKDPRAASAGGILVTRLMMRGVAGVVTDGGFRDADEIAAEAVEMTAYEDFVTEQVRAGRSIRGLYPATDPQSLVDFAAWRKAAGR